MAQKKLPDMQNPAALEIAAAATSSGSQPVLPKNPWVLPQPQVSTAKSAAARLQTHSQTERSKKQVELFKNGNRLTEEEDLAQEADASDLQNGTQASEGALSTQAHAIAEVDTATQPSATPTSNDWAPSQASGIQLAQLELPMQPSMGATAGSAEQQVFAALQQEATARAGGAASSGVPGRCRAGSRRWSPPPGLPPGRA